MTQGIQSSGGCHLIVFVLGPCCTAEIPGNESNLTLLRFFFNVFFFFLIHGLRKKNTPISPTVGQLIIFCIGDCNHNLDYQLDYSVLSIGVRMNRFGSRFTEDFIGHVIAMS